MVEWIRGQWRYSLTTESLKAEIQVEHTGDFDPEVMPYPNDYLPFTVLVREFTATENMELELLKVTGYAKATLKKRGFKEYRLFFGQEDWELVPEKKAQEIPLPHPLPHK
mgnify:CR=1 FL=1